ncbi:SecC motif-containing protein [Pseudomonas fluorescens]|uniref:SecC motif-containing protein n=1 Tax=Pseudomonas fluorescens TaxID=294 RepID=UPI001476183E|nr:SecC motif-containing protein [Pseudomonas fluorescens]NNB71600.1 SecC motif-containing protein [Pseudomonas fluorescens]
MISDCLLSEIDTLLHDWWKIDFDCEHYLSQLDDLKTQTQDDSKKNRIWVYHALLDCHLLNLKIFDLLKSGTYYSAWCLLEQLEITISDIQYNKEHVRGEYGLAFLDNAVSSWQALFPYKIFFSTREIIKKKSCSICGEPRSVMRSCGHRKRKIYGGEFCYDVVNEFELISFDAVANPVRKISVPIDPDNDHYRYSMLEAVLQEVKTPRQQFWAVKTSRPAAHHTGVHAPDFPCPCSRNTHTYLNCCMTQPFVERNHIEICFLTPMQVCLQDEDSYTY